MFVYYYYYYYLKIKIMERVKWLFVLVLMTGILFKIEHLPFGSELIILSWLLGGAYCVSRIIKGKE